MCFDHFGFGCQRQCVFLPLIDGVLNDAQGMDDKPAGVSVVMRLRGRQQLHGFAVFGDGLAVHRFKALRVDGDLASDAAQTVV